MKKRISIDDLQLGMRVIGLDQSWLRSPLWVHRQVIKSEDDIAILRQSGVREVDVEEGGVLLQSQDAQSLETATEVNLETCLDPHSPAGGGSPEIDSPTFSRIQPKTVKPFPQPTILMPNSKPLVKFAWKRYPQ